MENTGVRCDVCECRHNVGSSKCDLPEITVTERCTCSSQQVDIPHYCQSYEKKKVLRNKKTSARQPGRGLLSFVLQWRLTPKVGRLRSRVPTLCIS